MTVLQMLVGGDAPVDYPIFVKPIDETRTNTTTLTPDTHLQFVTEPNTIYFIRGGLLVNCFQSGEMKWTFQHTGTTTNVYIGARRLGAMDDPTGYLNAGNNDFWTIESAQLAAATPVEIIPSTSNSTTDRAANYFEGILSVGASGGVFSVIWAQSVLHATDLATMKAGSWLHRQIVTAAQSNIKTSDTARINTTTASADPALQEVLATGTDYALHLGAWMSSRATPDMKIGIDDGGGTPTYFAGFTNLAEQPLDPTVIPNDNEQTMKPIASLTGATLQPIVGIDTGAVGSGPPTWRSFWDMESAGRFSVSANPFALWWAQNTLSATLPATVHADSYLLVRPITGSGANGQIVWKTVDETRTSDAVMTDDDELLITLDANSAYIVSILALCQTGATPDFKHILAFTGTLTDFTGTLEWQGPFDIANADNDAAQIYGFTGSLAFTLLNSFGGATGTGGVRYSGLLRVGASGGVLKFQWAQNTSTASNTVVLAGSHIRVEKKA